LERIGVLELVHGEEFEPPAEVRPGRGRPAEKVAGVKQQVVEVEYVSATLFGRDRGEVSGFRVDEPVERRDECRPSAYLLGEVVVDEKVLQFPNELLNVVSPFDRPQR